MSVHFYIIVNYRNLLFNYYHVWILFVHVIIVLDHAHLDDIYIRVVVFETGMYSIYSRLDIGVSCSIVDTRTQ